MTPDPHSFRPLAGPYAEPEKWMLENVIADLRRGGIAFELRPAGAEQVEIWRAAAGWRELEEGCEQ